MSVEIIDFEANAKTSLTIRFSRPALTNYLSLWRSPVLQLRISSVICNMLTGYAVFLSLVISTVLAADSTGQKAHFQVEDKSGDLKIIATKTKAEVTAQADSVQVVVKPGTADFPVLKSDKPIVHVTQPGWHTLCFRKSAILKAKKPGKVPKKVEFNRKMKPIRRNSVPRKNSKYTLSVKPKKETAKISVLSQEKQDVSGSKKSDVKYSGFHVTGNAGNLKMHVTKDETTLSSESGGVDISLNKNPSSSSSASSTSSKRKIQTLPQLFREESGDKMIHIATELNNTSYIGLRKSIVTKLEGQKSD